MNVARNPKYIYKYLKYWINISLTSLTQILSIKCTAYCHTSSSPMSFTFRTNCLQCKLVQNDLLGATSSSHLLLQPYKIALMEIIIMVAMRHGHDHAHFEGRSPDYHGRRQFRRHCCQRSKVPARERKFLHKNSLKVTERWTGIVKQSSSTEYICIYIHQTLGKA